MNLSFILITCVQQGGESLSKTKMISHASPGLDVRCRTSTTSASTGAAAAAMVALLLVTVLVFSDAIYNGSGGGVSPDAVGQQQLQPIAKLSSGTSVILPAEVVSTSMVTDNETP